MEYVYEALTVLVFIGVSLIVIKPPQWIFRFGRAFANWMDRWM
jgi:hypothetical protein